MSINVEVFFSIFNKNLKLASNRISYNISKPLNKGE
jgi:hypothetical protein